MKVFQNRMKNTLTKSQFYNAPGRLNSQAEFVQRWAKINAEALLGGGVARIDKQHH